MRRREFLVAGFGWLPFFHRRFVTLAGISFRVMRQRGGHNRYLLIHGDESTARQVLNVHMETQPGIAFLVTGTARNVEIQGRQVDPNRIFSTEGAARSLRELNPGADVTAALAYLDQHRAHLISRLTPPPGGVLIALHNNQEYSVLDETAASDQVSLKEPNRPHEFFLATDQADFDLLKTSRYNAVLQNRNTQADDGSLSRLAARHGFRYVNLECGLGQFEAQLERLGWLDRHLNPPKS